MDRTPAPPVVRPDDLDDIRAIADEATRIGGDILRRGLGRVRNIRFKGLVDLVTEYDHRVEEAVTSLIRSRFPDHQILAEEGTVGGEHPEHVWYIDPLDGTTNFAHAFPVFCTSIAYEYHGQLTLARVFDPTRRELFHAEVGRGAYLNQRRLAVSTVPELIGALIGTGFPYDRPRLPVALEFWTRFSMEAQGLRRNGSAALEIAYVAAGRLDGFYESGLNPWDSAAGALLVVEAGGTITSFDGTPYEARRGGIIASNGLIHDAMLGIIRSK